MQKYDPENQTALEYRDRHIGGCARAYAWLGWVAVGSLVFWPIVGLISGAGALMSF